MIDTIVAGIDHHREWLLHVVSCDCVTGARKDFMWFFNTRDEVDICLERIARDTLNKNMIVKIIKVRGFEHLGLDMEHIEKEN